MNILLNTVWISCLDTGARWNGSYMTHTLSVLPWRLRLHWITLVTQHSFICGVYSVLSRPPSTLRMPVLQLLRKCIAWRSVHINRVPEAQRSAYCLSRDTLLKVTGFQFDCRNRRNQKANPLQLSKILLRNLLDTTSVLGAGCLLTRIFKSTRVFPETH
jgi:hypothetical protein